MPKARFTTGGEVASYLLVHVAWLIAASFWVPFLSMLVRNRYATLSDAAPMLGVVFMINLLVTIPLVMCLFFALRMAFTSGGDDADSSGFTTAPEAGAYLTSRLFMSTMSTALTVAVYPALLSNYAKTPILGVPFPSIFFFVSSLVLLLLGMLLFFMMRMFLPRMMRVCFSFAGRCSRAEYWGFSFAIYGIALAAVMIWFVAIGLRFDFRYTAGRENLLRAGSPIWFWYIFMLWPGLAIATKRCHDRGRSGWFLVLPYGGILVASVVSLVAPSFDRSGVAAGLASLVSLGLSVWLFVELGCLRGTIGTNRFGTDPVHAMLPPELRDPNLPPPIR
jgi:uncharacterized membrane protein YhaH (DUF805 family)